MGRIRIAVLALLSTLLLPSPAPAQGACEMQIRRYKATGDGISEDRGAAIEEADITYTAAERRVRARLNAWKNQCPTGCRQARPPSPVEETPDDGSVVNFDDKLGKYRAMVWSTLEAYRFCAPAEGGPPRTAPPGPQ